ncbi:MAG: hypothetical protein ACSHYB_14055 [Roseibacillus sp.]
MLVFSGVLLVFSACSSTKDEVAEPRRETPPVKIQGTALRFQSYLFTAPKGYQVLEDAKGAHVAGVFSEAEGAKLVKQLSSRRGFELTSTPTLTCRNNESGKVELIRELTYPTEYDPPSLPEKKEDHEGFFPVTPSSPKSFETRNVGFEASFKGRKVGDSIDFSFDVSRTSFFGFINYGSPITAPAKGLFGNPVDVVVTENRIEMPLFDVKKLASTVTMKSGQYLAIGGLSSDLQPALERLAPDRKKDLAPTENLFVLIRVELFE